MRRSLNGPIGKSSVEILQTIKKKKNIVEKLTNYFSNKLQNIMREKNYPFTNLEKEISKFFETLENKKINEFDYLIGKLEKYLLDLLNKNFSSLINNRKEISLKSPKNFLNEISIDKIKSNKSIDSINYLKSINTNKNINNSNILCNIIDENNKLDENIENIVIDKDIIEKSNITKKNFNNNIHHQRSYSTNKDMLPSHLYLNEKLTTLKEKANDEWALIAKYNHLKQIENDQLFKNNKEEKQKKFKELLQSQLMEKDMLKKIKQEEDWQFFLKQNDKLQSMENEEIRKKREKLQFLRSQKDIQEKAIYDLKNKKSENKNQEIEKDKIALEKIRIEMELEKDKINKKKLNEKEIYLSLIRDNEKKIEIKKSQKEIEKKNGLNFVKQYEEILDKHDMERNAPNPRTINRNNHYETKLQFAKNQNEMFKSNQENKYLREKNEIENKMKIIEDINKFRKHQQIEDMKKALQEQIEEKKQIEKNKKDADLKYHELVVSNVKKSMEDKETAIRNHQERINYYKNELDKQLLEKNKKRKFMDDQEKEYNNKLLQKIYSEIENFSNN